MGSVIRCQETDDDLFVLGVISVLNFVRYKDLKCVKQIKDFILEHCEDATKRDTFEKVILVENMSKRDVLDHKYFENGLDRQRKAFKRSSEDWTSSQSIAL